MRHTTLLLPLLSSLSLLGLGCPTDAPAEPPDDVHTWYEGTAQATKPDGTPLGDAAESLLRRSVLPSVARIDEQVVELEPGEDVVEVLAAFTIVPEDATFRVSFQDAFGLLEGTGLLSAGEVWEWTGWESTVVYQDGAIQGTTVYTEAGIVDGVLVSDSEIVDADGDLVVLVHKELATITEATFQARYAALVGR